MPGCLNSRKPFAGLICAIAESICNVAELPECVADFIFGVAALIFGVAEFISSVVESIYGIADFGCSAAELFGSVCSCEKEGEAVCRCSFAFLLGDAMVHRIGKMTGRG